jgi:putative membrane protein
MPSDQPTATPSDHRLHPSSILFALAGSLKSFLLPAVVLLLTSGRACQAPAQPETGGPVRWINPWMPGDIEIANWQFWILLFLIPSTIAAIVRYLSFRIHYEGTELVIRSGIFFRNERHVPYLRIQNLDAVRNVAHRLLGVAEVRLETGGGQEPEATIKVLHETVFEEMRRRIFEGRARVDAPALGGLEQGQGEGEPALDAVAPAIESRTMLHLPISELLLNGVLDNRGMFLVAAAYGVLWQAGVSDLVWSWLTKGWFGPVVVGDAVHSIAVGKMPTIAEFAVVILGIVGLLVLLRVLSMVWSVLRLYDFRLSHVGQDLRTEYGFLTRITATVPLRRVQSVTIRATLLQRVAERMSVRVTTAGGTGGPANQQNGPRQPREWLAPIIHEDAVPALVREVLPGFELDALDWQPLHPRAFRRTLKPVFLVALVGSLGLMVLFGWFALIVFPFIFALLAAGSWKYIRHTHWAITEDAVAFRSGWMWRHVTVVAVAKIQTVSCSESPFDRRAAMASVEVDTAGGLAPMHRVSIPYLARDTARALSERLSAQAAQTAFRW